MEAEIVCVDGRYRIGEKLGTTVYCSKDIITGQEFAIKLEAYNTTKSYLEHEYQILNKLQDGMTPGLPRPVWLGREGTYRAMVLSSDTLSLSQVAKIGIQLVGLKRFRLYPLVH
ncbi:hypothetical protein BS17DRAFT_769142 [Gyrodon lividus]|nr:hypothetical protein BS17DRAFT_769142 [Gyrodon lividus]